MTEVYNPKTFFLHAALLGQAFAHCPIFPTAASRRSLGRVSVPVWPFNLSVRLPIVDLVGHYPTNYLMGREPLLQRISPFTSLSCDSVVSCGISNGFPLLSPSVRQVAHALLTRPPLSYYCFNPKISAVMTPFDLHVLSTPPAFVLSQDQTLLLKLFNPRVISRLLNITQLLFSSLFNVLRFVSPFPRAQRISGFFVFCPYFVSGVLYSFQTPVPQLFLRWRSSRARDLL